MRGAVAGLCLLKIKALQDGRMMDGRRSFIHQGLFTSPLKQASHAEPPSPRSALKGPAVWFDPSSVPAPIAAGDGSHGRAYM